MSVPSFEVLLEQAKQIADYKAQQAQPQSGELLAKGLSGFFNQVANVPITPRESYIGSVNPATSEYSQFKTPVKMGGSFLEQVFRGGQEAAPEGSIPITQPQFAEKGLSSMFKKTTRPLMTQSAFESQYASLDMLRDAFPNQTDEALKLKSVGELQQTLANNRATAPTDVFSQEGGELKKVGEVKKGSKVLPDQSSKDKNIVARYQLNLKTDPEFKKSSEIIAASNTLEELLTKASQGNEVAFSDASTMAAKNIGEVGMLSESDVTRYSQGGSISRKVADKIAKLSRGVSSELTIDDMREISKALKLKAEERKSTAIESQANMMSTNLDISLEEARKLLGGSTGKKDPLGLGL